MTEFEADGSNVSDFLSRLYSDDKALNLPPAEGSALLRVTGASLDDLTHDTALVRVSRAVGSVAVSGSPLVSVDRVDLKALVALRVGLKPQSVLFDPQECVLLLSQLETSGLVRAASTGYTLTDRALQSTYSFSYNPNRFH